MSVWWRALIEILFGWWWRRQERQAFVRLQAQGVRTYLHVLQGARYSVMGVLGLLVAIQIMCFGLALMIAAGVFLSPLEMEAKLWVAFSFGAVLFFVPAMGTLILLSERLWYRISGANRMVDNVLDHHSPNGSQDKAASVSN